MALAFNLIALLGAYLLIGYAYGECDAPLGMENRLIPDNAITASSEWNENYAPANARLNFAGGGVIASAWSSKTNDKSQWIQVDLGENFLVTKMATQGRKNYAQWVTKYKISYSTDGETFTSNNKVYDANKDQNSIVVNTLEAPIKARFIRLEPQEWYLHISMRMELYGCSLKSVDGGYTPWSNWSRCSTTCNPGKRRRERSCSNPPPQHGGKDCSQLGEALQTKRCNKGKKKKCKE